MKPNKSLVLLLGTAASLAAAPLALDRSTITEVVNEVNRIEPATQKTEPAVVRAELRAPDRLRTGRQSRAELVAADGTITRLGSNTLFAFDQAGREMRLDQGSILFHSPSGKGGGVIRSTAASATVLGTTIIAAATSDGGYKLLVLEGHARVDFASGQRLQLEAGQMTFVMPGGGGTGIPGPVLRFDLSRQMKASRLLSGFERPLPSLPRIEAAAQRQAEAVSEGTLQTTTFMVAEATGDAQVNGIETARPESGSNTPMGRALASDAVLTSSALPADRTFTVPTTISEVDSPFHSDHGEGGYTMTGIAGRTIEFATPTLDLTNWSSEYGFTVAAKTEICLGAGTTFTMPSSLWWINLMSPLVTMDQGSSITATFGTASPGQFTIDTDQALLFNQVNLNITNGNLTAYCHTGNVTFTGGQITALPTSFGEQYTATMPGLGYMSEGTQTASSSTETGIRLWAPFGKVSADGTSFGAGYGGFVIDANQIEIANCSFYGGGNFDLDATTSIDLRNLDGEIYSGSFSAKAGDTISIRDLGLDVFSSINLSARTLVFNNVDFSSDSTINLRCETGMLAANPNTGANAVAGYVNFITNVTVDGSPAQNFVSTTAGGTSQQTPLINITKPTP